MQNCMTIHFSKTFSSHVNFPVAREFLILRPFLPSVTQSLFFKEIADICLNTHLFRQMEFWIQESKLKNNTKVGFHFQATTEWHFQRCLPNQPTGHPVCPLPFSQALCASRPCCFIPQLPLEGSLITVFPLSLSQGNTTEKERLRPDISEYFSFPELLPWLLVGICTSGWYKIPHSLCFFGTHSLVDFAGPAGKGRQFLGTPEV